MSTEDRLENLEEKVDKIEDAVNAIKDALLGNAFEAQGFIHRQRDLDKRVTSIERLWHNGKWFLIGMSVSAGVGVTTMVKEIAIFFAKLKS